MQPQLAASYGAGASPGLQMPGMPLQAAQMAQLRAMQAQQQLMVRTIPQIRRPLCLCCHPRQSADNYSGNNIILAKLVLTQYVSMKDFLTRFQSNCTSCYERCVERPTEDPLHTTRSRVTVPNAPQW